MSESDLSGFKSLLFISFGAVFGTWLRFFFLKHILPGLSARYWITFLLNLISSFALGLCLALESSFQGVLATSLTMFIVVGFLASFSTFSTFVFEVFQLLIEHRFKDSFVFAVFSIFGGLLSISAGYYCVNG